jgi:hypothetical protein
VTQVISCDCGYTFKDVDLFLRGLRESGIHMQVPQQNNGTGSGFISQHATAPTRDTRMRPDSMSNATRYPCAAAYLNPAFAEARDQAPRWLTPHGAAACHRPDTGIAMAFARVGSIELDLPTTAFLPEPNLRHD